VKTPDRKTILVPVDFSRYSNKAFLQALELAMCTGGQVYLIHVLDTDLITGLPHISSKEEYLQRWRKRSEEKLRRLYVKHQDDGVKIEISLREGKPYQCILEAADEFKADMIVMGSRGRTGLTRALFGSVAERVTRLCKVPILLIKQ